MSDQIPEHIDSFHSNTPQPIQERTEAQREASRRNGAKSRGPTTSEGLARSSANALRHGLLARQFMPPADYRGLDRLYRQIRAELVAEFKPATFTSRSEVDGLAHDYIRLARARQLIEQAARPQGTLSDEDRRKLEEVHQGQQDLRIMSRILALAEMPEEPLCTGKQAQRLAARMGNFLDGVEADEAEAALDAATTKEPDPIGPNPAPEADASPTFGKSGETPEPLSLDDKFELEEQEKVQGLLILLGPSRSKFRDRSYMAGLLCGNRPLTKILWVRLQALVRMQSESLANWIAGRNSLMRKEEEITSLTAAQLVLNPESLILLERYARIIERTIDRKLARLRRR